MIEVAAGIVAWLGASVVVLSDGRRGLALGMLALTAGLAVIAWQDAGSTAAAAIAAGGLVAAAGRLRAGEAGWHVMPSGSTPRLVLCVVVGLVALWFAFAITTGPGSGTRFAALSVLALAAARILWSEELEVQLTATGVLALAVAAASTAGSTTPDVWPYIAAGLVAAAVAWLPARPQHAA